MFSFRACFWMNDVYINDKYKFTTNEIITAYLNSDCLDRLEGKEKPNRDIDEFQYYKRRLQISLDMDEEFREDYNKNVKEAQKLLDSIHDIIVKLPPYNKILLHPKHTLPEILNRHYILFEDGLDDYDNIGWDTVNRYGSGDVDENGNGRFVLSNFEIAEVDDFDRKDSEQMIYIGESMKELNKEVSELFDAYTQFIKSIKRIKTVYARFICDYLNKKENFLNEEELARCFEKFRLYEGSAFVHACSMNAFGHKMLKTEANQPILCEEISFPDIGSFIYYDLFNGIKKNHIPNVCKNCGRYFLIRGGKYYNYCDASLKGEPGKTCRDVGSRRRYDEKCKTDPVWQTYNRAYKAHYARYLKKKMTMSEFSKWSIFASDIRDKALAEEIDFEEYCREIKV